MASFKLRGAVMVALATASQSAFTLKSTREISKPASEGIPITMSKGPRSEKPPPSKIELWRKDSIKRLEEAEKNLRLGGQQPDQAVAGLRQEVRARLREVEDNGASIENKRTVTRVMGLLLKSISDSARASQARARSTGRIKDLQGAIASSLGKSMEIEELAKLLNGTDVDQSILLNRFKYDEVLPTQSDLDKENGKEAAKVNLAVANLGLEGRKKTAKLQKALSGAEVAGVEDKYLELTRSHLATADTKQKAVDGLKSTFMKKDIDKLEDAIDKADDAKVNKLALELARTRLYSMKKSVHDKEIAAENAVLNKQHKKDVLELRSKRRDEARLVRLHKQEEKTKRLELRRQQKDEEQVPAQAKQ